MRLINTNTAAFEEFIGQTIPPYAILSHTWEDEEVSYQDFLEGACSHKKGYGKIEETLEISRKSDIGYAWIDTCCIDKSSSAELTEAINSMYRWYQRSAKCYVYLSDLETGAESVSEHSLRSCRWFSRGWTLQELIAPPNMSFYDSKWKQVGTKETLCRHLSVITGIDFGILSHREALSSVCVARKMSWAAERVTTRIEDMAYCLLGLFDVNMPLLYGEESKAFRRLQEEIIKTNCDLSIFAWHAEPQYKELQHTGLGYGKHCGLLAHSPVLFKSSGSFLPTPFSGFRTEFSVSNNGVKTQAIIYNDNTLQQKSYTYILPLNTLRCSPLEFSHLGVALRKVGLNTYVRDSPYILHECLDEDYTHLQGDNYILVDEPLLKTSRVRPQYPVDKLWTRLSLSPCHKKVLQIEFADRKGFSVENYWGCFDHDRWVYFVPEGDQTDGAGMRFSVCPPYDQQKALGISQRLTFECVLYAFGWFKESDRIQYTVLSPEKYEKPISVMERLLTQRTDTQHRTLRRMFDWKIPKVSSTAFPIPRSGHSAIVQLRVDSTSRRIVISCNIIETQPVTHEQSDLWKW